MDKQEFGQLIAALRKYQLDPNTGWGWTQRTLATQTNLSQKVIANIEQGRKAHLEPDILVRLADAFRLNTWERRTFFALSSGVSREDVVHEEGEPAPLLAEMLDALRALQLPAFMYDPFYHVVAANGASLTLHSLPGARPCAAPHQQDDVQFLCSVLAPNSFVRQNLHEIWDQFVRLHVLQFRTMSLRYRHTDCFQQLFDALAQCDEFRRAWAATQHDTPAFYSELKRYVYTHPQHGRLAYIATAQHALTAAGSLYLSTLNPLDEETAAIFHSLAQSAGPDVRRITSWPHKALRVPS